MCRVEWGVVRNRVYKSGTHKKLSQCADGATRRRPQHAHALPVGVVPGCFGGDVGCPVGIGVEDLWVLWEYC